MKRSGFSEMSDDVSREILGLNGTKCLGASPPHARKHPFSLNLAAG
jgi:hypothetical protein